MIETEFRSHLVHFLYVLLFFIILTTRHDFWNYNSKLILHVPSHSSASNSVLLFSKTPAASVAYLNVL